MTLRELEYLVALADHRNFRRAAEVCNVSQPTLSTQIRKLEEDLGVALIERAPRRILLTPAGEEAVARARTILTEATQLREAAARHRHPGAGRLRLGVFPTLGPYLLPHVVPRLMARYPDLELRLTEEKSALLRRRLIEGQLDAALLALPVEEPQLDGSVLFDEPFYLAVPPRHPLAREASVTPDTISDQHLMLLEEGHCLRDQALEVCRLSGAGEQVGLRGTSLETLRQMVMAGAGITLLPALAAQAPATGGAPLGILPFRSGGFLRRIGLFWRRSTPMTELIEATAQLISHEANRLIRAA